jgi:hypothetical protein
MPLYEYVAADSEKGCPICCKGFELRRPVSRPALEACPMCKQPVKKLIGQVSTPRVSRVAGTSEMKSAGFTILQKRDEGVYEKL